MKRFTFVLLSASFAFIRQNPEMPMKPLALAAAVLLTTSAFGEEPATPPGKVIKFPSGGRVLTKEKRIEIDGVAVYPTRAPIELFACAENGKEHEAIFALHCLPQDVHFALVIFGLKQRTDYPDKKGPEQPGDPAKPVGDKILIWVEWEVDGKKHRERAEDLLAYGPPKEKRSMPRVGWTFSGSTVWEPVDPQTGEKNGQSIYVANRERTLVATLHDPSSVIDNPLVSGGDDRMLHPNFDMLPPRGTKIVLAIEVPDQAALDEMKKAEDEADAEYKKKIEKDATAGGWKDLDETPPTPEDVPEGQDPKLKHDPGGDKK